MAPVSYFHCKENHKKTDLMIGRFSNPAFVSAVRLRQNFDITNFFD